LSEYANVSYASRLLYSSAVARVGEVIATPLSDQPGEWGELDYNLIVLPLRGLFTTHFSSRRQALVTTQDAVLLGSGVPHRYSFPGRVGDHCLALRWSAQALAKLAPESLERASRTCALLATRVALAPQVSLDRTMLWHNLRRGSPEPLAVEELALRILRDALSVADEDLSRRCKPNRRTRVRQRERLARTMAAIASTPERPWSLAELAEHASMSPYHLAHSFRGEAGMSVFEYVTRLRLERALDQVLESSRDLTTIALGSGFASHSHFTARFRTLFGRTPSELRSMSRHSKIQQPRNLTTAS
jgi:AraC family transcriptional regulator